MKKADKSSEEMRAEYRREELGPVTRGKYAAQYATASNVVVIDNDLVEAFPNTVAVNSALRNLLALARSATQGTGSHKKKPHKRAVG